MLIQSPHLSEMSFESISDQGLSLIATHCGPNLRIIEGKVSNNSNEAIKNLCEACPNLTVINLEHKDVDFPVGQVICTIVRCCPLIEVLPTVRMFSNFFPLLPLMTAHTLKDLKLFSYYCPPSAVFERILQANPNLTSISIFSLQFEDALVSCIGRHCRNLKRLDLASGETAAVSADTLQELFVSCPQLESFCLKQDGQFTNNSLRALLETCHHLTELDLRIFDPAQVPDLDDALTTPYPSLTKLELMGKGISANAMRGIFTYCPNLRDVYLMDCDLLTDEIISIMTQTCCKLEVLTIANCKNITITGMLEIAAHCASLRALDLYHTPMNDEFMIQLSLHCKRLTKLSIMFGHSGPVTEAGVLVVVKACTGLTFLTIHGNILMPLTSTLALMQQRQLYKYIKCTFADFDDDDEGEEVEEGLVEEEEEDEEEEEEEGGDAE